MLGSVLELRKQGLLPFLRKSQRKLGDVFRMRVGTRENYVVAHPEGAAHVLQQNARNYTKSRSYQRLVLMLGRGLVTTEGEVWRRQRTIAQPFFQRPVIKELAGTMTKLIDARMGRWQAALRAERAIDVKFECKALNFDLIAGSLFGVDPSEDGVSLGRATDALSDFVESQRWQLFPLPSEVPTPRRLMARYNRWCVDRVANRYAATERGRDNEGLISMLIDARNEQGEVAFTAEQVRDQIVTLLITGYETTAAGLVWTMYLLAKHPDVAARIRADVDRVIGRRVPVADDIKKISYLSMVVSESMRLYPPVWVIGRRSIAPDTIGGYSVPADAPVGVYPSLIHRHPEFWPRPDEFDPENFTPAAIEARPKLAYLPFGGGARSCIGNHLAMLELQLCIAMFVQRFDVSVPDGYEPHVQPFVTLTPPDGIPLRLRERVR